MVVLLIAVLIAGLAIPRFARAYQSTEASAAARDLLNMMTSARDQAIVNGRKYRITLDTTERRIALQRYNTEAAQATTSARQEMYVSDPDAPVGSIALPPAVSLAHVSITPLGAPTSLTAQGTGSRTAPRERSQEEQYIMFYPDGTADSADILLRGGDGSELMVELDQMTGRSRLLENDEKEQAKKNLGIR